MPLLSHQYRHNLLILLRENLIGSGLAENGEAGFRELRQELGRRCQYAPLDIHAGTL